MKVPLVDLRAGLKPIKDELFAEFDHVLSRMELFLGRNVTMFEREFADFCQVEHGIGVSSGTDALSVALRALEIGPGDEVIVPSHTFFATIEAIVHTGATPVMVDIEPATMTVDPDRIAAAVSGLTRAILAVHLYGHPADMDPILAIARDRGLRVIEDCAQAHGARYKGRRCGSIGDAAAFSFYFTKNLGAYGEGGFVTTKNPEVAERIRLYRNHGHVSKFEHARIGFNLRLDELQAAVLRLKLRHLDENNRRRLAIARRYDALFADTPIRTLTPQPDCEPVYHLYPLLADDRDALNTYLQDEGIGTGIHYKIPGHRQPALQGHPHRCDDCPVTEDVCRSLVSIPMYPELTDAQVEFVADRVKTFMRKKGNNQ